LFVAALLACTLGTALQFVAWAPPTCEVCESYCYGQCSYIGWFEYKDCTCNACVGNPDLDLFCQGKCNKYWCNQPWPWPDYECFLRIYESSTCNYCCG
jgi:hypothetical protein